MDEVRFVSATGVIGAGVSAAALDAALAFKPHFIAADGGTTDAGPFSLGSGEAAFPREAVKADLAVVLAAGKTAGIPVIVGSVGTAGADRHVDWTMEIVSEICDELGLVVRTAVIKSEQKPEHLVELLKQGRIAALEPAPLLDDETLRRSVRIVGMMGVEPIQAALRLDVDLIIAGRASDSALFAAYPIMHGLPEGLSWHAGKIVECGTMACETLGKGVMLATVRHDHVVIRPIGQGLRCTPQSVAAHSLYENADPFLLGESSGTLDLTGAVYEQADEVSVRVSGSTFHRADRYSVKREGAELAGYSTVMIGGIRDPYILQRLDSWLAEVRTRIEESVAALLGLPRESYQIAIHRYGRDAVMDDVEPSHEQLPIEVGIVFEALADSQVVASKIAQLARQPLLHHPVPEWSGSITTIAYLHNPPHVDRGPVYRFNLNHVALPASQEELFRMELVEVGMPAPTGLAGARP
jgi:hypothetical protein